MKTPKFKTLCRQIDRTSLSILAYLITQFVPIVILLVMSYLSIMTPEHLTQKLQQTANPETLQQVTNLQQALIPFQSLLATWLMLTTCILVWQTCKPIMRTLWKIRLITPLLWKVLKQKLMI